LCVDGERTEGKYLSINNAHLGKVMLLTTYCWIGMLSKVLGIACQDDMRTRKLTIGWCMSRMLIGKGLKGTVWENGISKEARMAVSKFRDGFGFSGW